MALRSSEQIDSEAHEPERHKHANRNEAGATCNREDLLVGDGLDYDGYFLAFRAVLSVVRATEGSPAALSQLLTCYAIIIGVQVVRVCGVSLKLSLGLLLGSKVCASDRARAPG